MSVTRAAVGVALHSAWAMAVTLAGPPDAPLLLDRRRIELAGVGLPAQAYHAAAESGLSLAEAETLVERCRAAAKAGAKRGLAEAVAVAEEAGHHPTACAIAADVKDLPDLAVVLRAHPLLHAAEGQLSREAVAEAAAAIDLALVYVSPKASADPAMAAVIATLGRTAGPPWTADQKKAARAALLFLAAPALI